MRKKRKALPATMTGSITRFCGAAGFAAILLPLHAHAQIIDQYVPRMGVAAGEVSDEPTQVRATQSYQPLGARWGPLSIAADGSEDIGFTSNADQLPEAHKSSMVETQGHLGAIARFEHDDQAHGDISVDDIRYPARSLQNRTNWTGSLGGVKHFGRDELGASFTHLSLVQMPTEAGALIVVGPVPYTVEDGRVSYLVNTHTKFSIMPEVSVQRYRFGKPEIPGIGVQDQSYRDRVVINEGATLRYEHLQHSHFLVIGKGTEMLYDYAHFGYPSRNSNGFSVVGGYDYNEAGPFQFRAVIGYQLRTYTAALYRRVSSPIVEATARWTPTHLTTAELSIAHGIEDSAFTSIIGFTDTRARLNVTHAFSRNIVFGAHASVGRAAYPQTSAALNGTPIAQQAHDQDMYGFGANAVIYLDRHISLNIAYDYGSQSAYLGPMFPVHYMHAGVHFAL